MKKFTLLTCGVLALATSVKAQLFQDFVGKSAPVEFGNSVAINTDSAMVIAGSYKNSYSATNTFPVIMRLKKDGNVQWIKQLNITGAGTGSGDAVCNDAVKNAAGTSIGHITLVYKFPNLYLVRTNNAGGIMWGRLLSNTSFSSNYGLKVRTIYNNNGGVSGFYMLATHFGNSGEFVVKFNTTGGTVWQKRITNTTASSKFVSRDLRSTSDGGCIITGYQEGSTSNPILFKLTSAGAVTFAKSYDFFSTPYSGGFGVAVISSGYAITGSENSGAALVFTTNTSGGVTWANKYTSGSISEMHSNSIITDAGGNLVFGGHNLLTTTPAFLVKTNAAGTVTFGKTYYSRVGMNDIKLSTQGYCVVGTSDNYSAAEDIYVINTNTNGDITSGCNPTSVVITRTSPDFISQVNATYFITDEVMTNTAVTVNTVNIPTELSRCGTAFTEPETSIASTTGTFSAYSDLAAHSIKLQYTTAIAGNTPYLVTLYNLNGLPVAKKEITANTVATLQVSDIKDGLYVAVLMQNGKLMGKQNVLWGK